MEENPKVKALVRCVEIKREHITRLLAAEEFLVPKIVQCPVATVDDAITVQILIHHVTRREILTQRLHSQSGLCGSGPVVSGIISVKHIKVIHIFLISFRYPQGLISPDLVYIASLDVGVNGVCRVVRISGDLRARVREDKTRSIGQAAGKIVFPRNLKVPAMCAEVTVIRFRDIGSKDVRQFSGRPHHILRVSNIVLKTSGQPAVEQAPIKAKVVIVDFLPCQQLADKGREPDCCRFRSALKPLSVIWLDGKGAVGLIPVVNVLVAQYSIRSTQL